MIERKDILSFVPKTVLVLILPLVFVFSCLGDQVRGETSSPQARAVNRPVNRPVKDKWALVVGISKFQNGK
ncbi:MAG: hypothetical protein K8F91_17385, partial [Candidatus Obscuribacterales bacterium]|nr:hypothetical protein [Candidatus Obscuribacterales bacterium]